MDHQIPELETEIKEPMTIPFNNLFLNSGIVNGYNQWWMYIFGISASMLGYVCFQFFLLIPLTSIAMSHGISVGQIQADPAILFDPGKIGCDKNLFLAMMFGMFVFT